jgi:hypothetical protein
MTWYDPIQVSGRQTAISELAGWSRVEFTGLSYDLCSDNKVIVGRKTSWTLNGINTGVRCYHTLVYTYATASKERAWRHEGCIS